MSGTTTIPITLNGAPAELSLGSTIAQLLQSQGLDPAKPGVAVAVNAMLIRRVEWVNYPIQPEDRIEIVHARQGG
jgi:sulfur carrier protein